MSLSIPQGLGQVLQVGKMVMLRTVTLYYIGRVKAIDGMGVLLEDAAWVADQGTMNDCLRTGQVKEWDTFDEPVYVALAPMVDCIAWKHKPLPAKK